MMDGNALSVVVFDEYEMSRAGTSRLLSEATDITVVGAVESWQQAIDCLVLYEPDVLVMDLVAPGLEGIKYLRTILYHCPDTKALVLSLCESVAYPGHVIQAGALGYITKRTAPDVLWRGVREVAAGRVFLERKVAQSLVLNGISGSQRAFSELSRREFEVFLLLAEGQTVTSIAEGLFLSPKTVGTYQTRIMRKLKVHSAASLARLAIRHGLLQP